MLLIAVISLCDFTEALCHNLVRLLKTMSCRFTRIKVYVINHKECTFHYLLFLDLGVIILKFQVLKNLCFCKKNSKIKVLIVCITQFPFSGCIGFEII